MQKITPFLWFNDQALPAAKFYTGLFKSSKILEITRYRAGSPGPRGKIMTVTFQLAGQKFIALNGGPVFEFNPAISLFVNCKNQREIDRFWQKLSRGGRIRQCGWVTDKFGVTWQIVPTALGKLLGDRNEAKAQRAMQAMLRMQKLDLAALQRAHQGK